MAKHNETGLKGELIAVDFLVKKGYNLLHRNWRFRHKEVDLIMGDGDWLVIIEVKTRRGVGYGFPEESVNGLKQSYLRSAAGAYFSKQQAFGKVRFDVVSIVLEQDDMITELLHLEDAF